MRNVDKSTLPPTRRPSAPNPPRAMPTAAIQTSTTTAGSAKKTAGVPPGKAAEPTVAKNIRLVASNRMSSTTVLVISPKGVLNRRLR